MLLFGIGFFIWGMVLLVRYMQFKKIKPVKGMVTACEKKKRKMQGTSVEEFEIEVSFDCSYGSFHKKVRDDQPLMEGEYVDVRFDMAKDKLALERTYKKTASYPIVFMITGVVVTIFGIILEIARASGDDGIKVIMAAGICIIFLLFGIWLSFIMPYSRKKKLKNCDVVEGVLVDFVKSGYSSNGDRRGRDYHYSAVYEYTYGGMTRRFRSSASGNGGSHTELGRKVSIAVNHVTGEVLCLEDEKTLSFVGIIFIILAVIGGFLIKQFV